ncbi:RsiV family protein [Oceanobacillus bengalensis]|uniref:DUF3298 domain-containing protein n=1 Tax=Oceanobacillus bengalensis TaxID=1435466 RepID=A0A494YSU3_9BACI|nr:RsiV family protein [Oceanobacillus bengalensis]RKQ13205.1 hypothetical protein D8M05_17050 [Oceanobacillus bengalensis]
MRKTTAFLFIIIPFLFMFGCDENKETAANEMEAEVPTKQVVADRDVEEEKAVIPNLTNYETIRLEEITDQREITIEYPHFNYEPIDRLIESEMESDFENQKRIADDLIESGDEDGFGSFHFYNLRFDEPNITKDYVSIHFDGRISMGAPTGHPVDYSFNYDLDEDELITLEEILKEHQTNLLVISEQVADEIINDERFGEFRDDPVSDNYIQLVKEETAPSSENFQSFTLDEDGITFFKTYFSILPNSEGIVGVKVDWDKLESVKDTSHESSQSLDSEGKYVNEEYKFLLEIPESWEGKYITEKGNWHPTAISSIDFQFVNEGEKVSNIFSINIYDKDTDVSPGMETIVAEGNDYLYTYNTVMELPLAFYEDGELSHLEGEFLKMVNEDIPEMMNSFTLQ